ncbi:MAG: alcohol dehydrogenase catalytic domain-containing protein [Armatimonadota bacterium]|nr:alcohol dehydrogenase catalytic domain-containing protein [Armatimonadota bacterium]MDW8157020.1 alcohol dehydrogenase catalytic domain-containing protein [Armatimonadota bacterium]
MRAVRALVLREHGYELWWEEVPTPVPGRGEVLVRVEACGVGLTVLNYMSGVSRVHAEKLPRVPGHEFVGTVVACGPEVDGSLQGQRVMAYFYLSCGSCEFCRLAHEPLCRRLRGQVGVASDGGFAEYATLPAFNALPVPEGVDPIAATVIPDAVSTPFHVCRRAAVGARDVAVVVGAAGGVGIHMVQMLRAFGARVVGVDRGEGKLQTLRSMGFHAVDAGHEGWTEQVREVAGGSVTVAVDLVGRPETLERCVDLLGPRGRLVVLTTFRDVNLSLSPARLVAEEIQVLGCRYASRWEVEQAARMVQEGRVQPVVSEVRPLERAAELVDRLRQGTLLGRGAVVPAQSHT